MRLYAANRRAQGSPIQTVHATAARVCVFCGESFNARADTPTRFCSMLCVGASRRKPRQPRPRKSRRRIDAERKLRLAARGTRGTAVWVHGACVLCGTLFTFNQSQARYCSLSCRDKAHSGRWIHRLDRLAIYRRDAWTCQICGEVTEPNAASGSAWYPSLDHIIPRSLGGPDDWDNLRTAHNWCNSVRGDLTRYTDADLAA